MDVMRVCSGTRALKTAIMKDTSDLDVDLRSRNPMAIEQLAVEVEKALERNVRIEYDLSGLLTGSTAKRCPDFQRKVSLESATSLIISKCIARLIFSCAFKPLYIPCAGSFLILM